MTKIIKTPTLTTRRLILNPLTLDDAPALQKHFNNWNIIKHLNGNIPWPYPDNGAFEFIKNDALPRIKSGKAHLWTISLKTTSNISATDPIGLIEFRAILTKEDQENRGFWIAEPFWNKGYVSEAVTAVNDFIFFDYKKDKITLQNYKMNPASRRVKEKTGAHFVKVIKQKWRDQEREVEIWELTAEQWKKFRKTNP